MSSSQKQAMNDQYFKEGSEVEISSTDQGLIGSWFLGTIIRSKRKSNEAIVEYKHLMDDKDKRLPLQEEVDLKNVRPPQPDVGKRGNFNVNDAVDAYYHDGWWEGIITGYLAAEDKFVVYFKNSREQRAFKVDRLRVHREWVNGKWFPALDKEESNSKVAVESPRIEVPVAKKHKIRSEDELRTPAEVAVKSPRTEVPALKKHQVRSQDELLTPSKVARRTARMQLAPCAKQKITIRSQDDSSTPSEVARRTPRMQLAPCAKQKITIRSQDDSSTPSEVAGRTPRIQMPAFTKQKITIRSQDDSLTASEVAVKSPRIEEPALKKQKHKIRSEDDSFTPSEDVPSIDQMQGVSSSVEILMSTESMPNKEQAYHDFIPGNLVEARLDDEGFEGAWFTATIVQTLNSDKYVIRYQDLLCDDGKTPLTEEADSQHLRPCPPEISIVDRYSVLEYVEAFHDDGWWIGIISKVLKDDRYKVYFDRYDEEMKFTHSQLRVHQEWINGRWITPKKASRLP